MADILIIDDQDRYLSLCQRGIPEHRYFGPARSWDEAQDLLRRRRRIQLVLLDVHFDIAAEDLVGVSDGASQAELAAARRTQGLHILERLHRQFPDLPVILMTSREELQLESSREALLAEDFTYFLDDDYVDARALQGQIDGILRAQRGETSDGPVFWGRGNAMRRIRQRLGVLARGRLPVVLLGPTGTGKSLLARHFVHRRSGRSGNFVSVDLATVPRDLMAAHLFGSVKGAYTGSVGDRTGAFEAAHRGTLFLDEVGNLTLDAQKLLLSVLQEGSVTRLGDLKPRPIDVKVVCATNEDLAARVQDGTFRADLYMRLNPATAIRLPSLSERRLDMDALLTFVMEQALARPNLAELIAEYRQATGLGSGPVQVLLRGPVPEVSSARLVLLFPERAMRQLRAHTWPGNLREFAMVVENAVLFAVAEMSGLQSGKRQDVIQVRPRLIRDLLQSTPTADEGSGPRSHFAVQLTPESTLNRVSVAVERQYFTQLYLREEGDFARMAEVLLGDAEHARKVQLRFNQLGLKVRELKAQLG